MHMLELENVFQVPCSSKHVRIHSFSEPLQVQSWGNESESGMHFCSFEGIADLKVAMINSMATILTQPVVSVKTVCIV